MANKKSVSYDTRMAATITEREYRAFQEAYDFLNAKLFAGIQPGRAGRNSITPAASAVITSSRTNDP
jgi:hypothetical protein